MLTYFAFISYKAKQKTDTNTFQLAVERSVDRRSLVELILLIWRSVVLIVAYVVLSIKLNI